MKLLLIDSGSMSLDLALRAQHAGHKVRTYMRNNKDGTRSEVGDGLIERIPHWEDSMRWADLIFCTDNDKYIYDLERFRDQGYPIIGPSMDSAEWEKNRIVGAEVHKTCGVRTIPT